MSKLPTQAWNKAKISPHIPLKTALPSAKITLQLTHSDWSNLVTHTACPNSNFIFNSLLFSHFHFPIPFAYCPLPVPRFSNIPSETDQTLHILMKPQLSIFSLLRWLEMIGHHPCAKCGCYWDISVVVNCFVFLSRSPRVSFVSIDSMLNYGSSCRVGSSNIKYEITAKFFYKKTAFNQLQKFQTKNCNTYMSEYINKKKVIL